ncbi:MAG: NADH-quinone oxidoreductase subunit C [Bacteroidetes bacterium]|nr:NADH-quinone oxidoreductase subunit C [Bacteroidota bacterium]
MDTQTLLTAVESKLKAHFADGLVSSSINVDYPEFVVKRDLICDVVRFLYNDEELAFQYLTTMATIHYPENLGQEFAIMYQLHNLPKNLKIRVKIFFSSSDVNVPSITSVFSAANWMERQEFDFFGMIFRGHPNLKRILNMDEMTYYPMRKEYALEDGTREDKDDKMFGR